jgi:FG-GAP-like repeat
MRKSVPAEALVFGFRPGRHCGAILAACLLAGLLTGNVWAQTPQTINFDAIPAQIFGISPFAIAAKASSGLAVGFVSTTPAVCRAVSVLLELLSTGTCSVTASQPGNAGYSAAPSVMRTFTVKQATPSNSFAVATGSPFAAGASPFSVAVGDFNRDGIQDLAVADEAGSQVTVLLGNGSGGFKPATGSPFAAGVNPFSVVTGDFNGDGIPDLAAADEGSSFVTVLLGNGTGGFTPATGSPFQVGSEPISLAVGDFNGDGIQDIVTVNRVDGTVTVLLGNGAGAFKAAASPYKVGASPYAVAVGDFNGDGIQDVAVPDYDSGTLMVLLGTGAGAFKAAPGSPITVGAGPQSVVVGDFNGDGIQDVAIANSGDGTITVLLGTGTGGFSAAPGSPFPAGKTPISLATGDFNGDGIQDIVIADLGDSTVTVLWGNGSGRFTPAAGSPFTVGASPESVAVGDFNGDGVQDIVTANQVGGNATVLLGRAAGGESQTITFGQPGNVTYGAAPFPIAATSTSALTVFLGSMTSKVCGVAGSTVTIVGGGLCSIVASQGGNAAFAAALNVTRSFTVNKDTQTISGFGPLGPAQDLVAPAPKLSATASSGLAVQYAAAPASVCKVSNGVISLVGPGLCTITASQPGNVNYLPAPAVPSQSLTVQILSQNITFDSIPNQILGISPFEIAVQVNSPLPLGIASTTPLVCRTASGLVMLLSAGTCSLTASQAGNAGYTAAAPVTRSFVVSQANPSLPFTQAAGSPITVGVGTISAVVGDFNGDGIPDLATATPANGNVVTVLLGDGAGGFVPAPNSPFMVGAGPQSVVTGDFNGDGFPDLATANEYSGNVTVLLGDGGGGFAQAAGSPFQVGNGPISLVVGDFNSDGVQDLAVANFVDSTVTVLLGNGLGGFTAEHALQLGVTSFPGAEPMSVAVGDFNGDGHQDLVTANSGGNNVSVLLGDGKGGFLPATTFGLGNAASPYSVAVGDFHFKTNGKHYQDLAVANELTNSVTVLLGDGAGGFTPAANSPFAVGTSPVAVVVGDFTGHGLQDLAAANFNDNTVTVLRGDGAGGFTPAPGSPFAVGKAPYSLAVGDLNGDGIEDLAAANDFGGTLTVLLGAVKGTTPQTITFLPLSNEVSGVVPFPIGATAASGLVVRFGSLTPKVCWVRGNLVSIVGLHTCTIKASQPGSINYAAAKPVTQSFTVSASAGPPTIVSLSPSAGAGTSVKFTAVYADPNGASDLQEAFLLVNSLLSGVNGCSVRYQPQGKLLSLGNDAGTAYLTALTLGVAGTASNSRCTLNAGTSTAVMAGNDLTLTVALSFTAAITGTPNVYLSAVGLSEQTSASVKEGTWTPNPTAGPPAIVSLSPNTGAGASVTFKAVYSDPNGAGDLSTLLLQMNTTQSGSNGCFVYYQPLGNHLYLANNAGAWITPALTPGVAGTAANSQCTLNAASSSVTMAGNNLTLNVALSFTGTFVDSRNVYLYAGGFSGQNSGWVKEGAWTPNPIAQPPTVVSLSPNTGTGTSVTLKAIYSDPNGAGDLNELLLQVNSARGTANACYVYYQPQGNHLYLANNAGAWITPALTPGVAGTAANSQCSLDAASSSVAMAGNNLTLTVALTFNGAFVGPKNVYLYAAGASGQNSGWVTKGAWTP